MNGIYKQSRKNGAIFVIAAVIVICFLLCSFVFVYLSRNENEKKSIQYLRDATSQRQAALDQQIESDLQILRGVVIGLEDVDLSNNDTVHMLLDRVNRSNSFVRMGLAGTDGHADMIDLDGTVYEEIDFSDMDFFQAALEGGSGVSSTECSLITGHTVNYYAVPVYQKGKMVGVLCATNTFEVLWDILNVPVFKGEGLFLILDKEGCIVAPPVEQSGYAAVGESITASVSFSEADQSALLEALVMNRPGSYMAEMSGESVVVTNQPLSYNGWHVVSVVSRAGIIAYYNQTAIGTIVIVLVASLFFVLLLLWQKRMMNRNQRSLEALAYTDTLTGLSNQDGFLLIAERLLKDQDREGMAYAVWSFDINNFNNVNDIFGASVGNRVLIGVASVFVRLCPKGGALCRVSSDFFAGILPYRDKQDLRDWCYALWEELEKQDVVPTSRIRISSAIGLYCIEDYPDAQIDVSDMISRASLARKQAKMAAKNELCFFTEEMSDRVHWETEMEAGGKAALTGGEITFFLQPKVDLQNCCTISGAEALARWKHPVHGWILPNKFIPLFENNGFIVELDRYIFEQACKWYAQAGIQKGPAFQLAVNVSRQGLQRTDFIEYYSRVKEHYGIADGVLELEFTETIALNDYIFFQSNVDELHKKGFMCSIDDFGSGYSSLNVLKNLFIDVLKLDAGFLRDGIDLAHEQTVISSFIDMARRLGIKTVAEGVETSQQVIALKQYGCDTAQGYYFSGPLSKLDFEKLMKETGGNFPPVCADS